VLGRDSTPGVETLKDAHSTFAATLDGFLWDKKAFPPHDGTVFEPVRIAV
jgi:hypothetical protein